MAVGLDEENGYKEMEVLVLDQKWQPTNIIDLQHAVVLLVTGKAVPVTDTPIGIMRSVSTEYEIPAVIRICTELKRAYNGYSVPQCSKRRVLARDDNECQFIVSGNPCQERATTIDHLHPRSKGGDDSWENLVAACRRHNAMKKDRYFEEMTERFGWSLKRKPITPRFMIKKLATRKVVHPEWEYFLGTAAV